MLARMHIQHELRQRALKTRKARMYNHETAARNLGGGFKIHHAQRFADVAMFGNFFILPLRLAYFSISTFCSSPSPSGISSACTFGRLDRMSWSWIASSFADFQIGHLVFEQIDSFHQFRSVPALALYSTDLLGFFVTFT